MRDIRPAISRIVRASDTDPRDLSAALNPADRSAPTVRRLSWLFPGLRLRNDGSAIRYRISRGRLPSLAVQTIAGYFPRPTLFPPDCDTWCPATRKPSPDSGPVGWHAETAALRPHNCPGSASDYVRSNR